MRSLFHAVKNSMLDVPQKISPDSAGDASHDVREASFLFDADFAGFDGHFPGDPMVPGVAQIMAAVLTTAPEREARLRSIGRSKFLKVVRPGDTMRVHTMAHIAGDGLRVTADLTTHNGLCAQLQFVVDQ